MYYALDSVFDMILEGAGVNMPDSAAMTIRLSSEARDFVRQRVELGEFLSEEEVISDSIEALRWETQQREVWEREVLLPAYDRLKANPGSALSGEEVRSRLEEARRLRQKAS